MVVVVGVVEEEAGVGDAVFSGNGGVVNLRNADVENSVSGANNEWMFFAERIGEADARAEVKGFERNFARGWEEWIRNQSRSGEGLQIPAHAGINGEVVGDANRVLGEGGVIIGIGMRGGLAEILDVVLRHGVGVGAQRRERQSGFHGREGEGVHFDGIEKIFAALLAGKEVVDPGEQGIAAELEGVAPGIEAESFGEMEAMLAGGAGKNVGAANGVNDGRNLDQRVGGVGVGLLQVAGELGAEDG